MVSPEWALAHREITTIVAAHRLGFTTGGNLCRTVKSVTGVSSNDICSVHGWNHLLILFAWRFLGRNELAAWETLDNLFQREAA